MVTLSLKCYLFGLPTNVIVITIHTYIVPWSTIIRYSGEHRTAGHMLGESAAEDPGATGKRGLVSAVGTD